ncbi:hypothetical protein [Geothrix sp. 21YS21S-4]|uniref:hypothetical protein n=1 Tax=Geothrix sp. 21YS21S-4 TaxID=3068889 RepID=UPI0027B9521D|nr:hypothetical protein [Geothrix sp. 21YS21S-4]
MAIQLVPFAEGTQAERELEEALERLRRQWTFQLVIGPKRTTGLTEQERLSVDIENNGGMWGDHARNLQRVLFEMDGFIRLRLSGGKEVPPLEVAYQRSFGMGLDRRFFLVFPKVFEGRPVQPPFEVIVREFGQGMGMLRFQMEQAPPVLAAWRIKRLWKQSAQKDKF